MRTPDFVRNHRSNRYAVLAIALSILTVGAVDARAQQASEEVTQNPAAGTVFVHSKFGGQIFGFDLDQNGTEGVLSEAQTLASGNVLAAVETFDQKTGKIIKVLTKTQTQDDFVTMGIVGNSVGLVEREHVQSLFHVQRTFQLINPVSANQFTGTWKPPIDQQHIITSVSRTQGTPVAAVWAEDVSLNFTPVVFTSNIAANKFNPVVPITDPNFTSGSVPALGFDSVANQIILGHSTLGDPFIPPVIGIVDMNNGGTFTTFDGVGIGDVNGMAVDPETHTACTTTEIDFSVQFYDLSNRTGFSEILPGATNQLQSAADVEFDPIHKLFLVAQPVSSTAFTGSSIHVFDEQGNLKESINGLNFSNAFSVIPVHIALNPSKRMGFIDGPDSGVTDLQSFTY